MNNHRKSFEILQAGRALAAMAVVVFHINATMALSKYYGKQLHAFFTAGDSGVAFFFVLSGVVMTITHENDLWKNNKFPISFLLKRFQRIYLPLWPVLGIVLVLQYIYSHGQLPHALAILSAFLITPATQEPLLAVEWTLRHEVLFYGFFALLIWRPLYGFIGLTLWFIGSLFGAFASKESLLNFFFSAYHLLFLMGMMVGYFHNRKRIHHAWMIVLIGLSVFAIAWSIVAFGKALHSSPLIIWAYGIGASLIMAGGMELERNKAIRIPTILSFLGAASYAIYLVHFPIISAMCKAARMLPTAPAALVFIIIFIVSLIFGAIFHVLIEKPIIQAFKTTKIRAGNHNSISS